VSDAVGRHRCDAKSRLRPQKFKAWKRVGDDTFRLSFGVVAGVARELNSDLTNERQMTVSSANRTALFIDEANLHSTAKALGFDIDYKRLLEEFQSHNACPRILLHRGH
jgi:hypothetical protein